MRNWAIFCVGILLGAATHAAPSEPFAPVSVLTVHDGQHLLVVGSVGHRAALFDRQTLQRSRTISLPAPASGAAVSGHTAYITTDEPAGRVLAVDLDTGTVRREYAVGHTPLSPLLGVDGRTLYVACRFNDRVAFLDLISGAVKTVPVSRQPVALALTPDGKRLFVANHLPVVEQALDDENPDIAAEVSVLDAKTARVLASIRLPNGSQGLRGIAVSPDGRWAVVTHTLSHYAVPATRVDGGAMNMHALSLIDARSPEWVETVMLDDPSSGAATPWALAFTPDGQKLFVTHAGTHELSVIDFPALIERVKSRPNGATGLFSAEDLNMMKGLRRRVPLGINGPRALAITDGIAYAAGYFSDTLATVDFRATKESMRLGSVSSTTAKVIALDDISVKPSAAWRGEAVFNDASGCFQTWQSCATCHPDGRDDALYWDLLNDGANNTKNTKSLLMAALTPPAMWRGVRPDAMAAVQAGFRHIEFAEPRSNAAEQVEAYLRDMRVVPSPYLDAHRLEPPRTNRLSCAKCHVPGVARGTLTDAARRGKILFEGRAGCAACHPHPTFTTGKQADAGLGTGVPYDIPSLVEVWRTAPYLHSGEAVTLRDAIIDHNFLQRRGRTRDLSEQEVEDLLAFVRSL